MVTGACASGQLLTRKSLTFCTQSCQLVFFTFLVSFTCRYSLTEQMMGNSVDSPTLDEVLRTFYVNMRTLALKGAPYIELVEPGRANIECDKYWHEVESGQITLAQLNQELAKRFGGNDLNSVFEPVLEPMNRAGGFSSSRNRDGSQSSFP